MKTRIAVDSAGRVLIPKSLRDELRIEAGDTLELTSDGELMTLQPVRGDSALRKKQGVWVFYGSKNLSAASTDEALQRVRSERNQNIIGSKK